jgi:release factor glutamine methyltransferase
VGYGGRQEERVNIGELLAEAVRGFAQRAGLPDPARETRWLLAQAAGQSETWIVAHADEPVTAEVEKRFRAWVVRRAAGEPAHYIVGRCPFWGRMFSVTPAVLIPRPETELLVECALTLETPVRPRVLDVGTGSGCLAVTLAIELPGSAVRGTDLSLAAVEVARRNSRALRAGVRFTVGNLTAHLRGPFDIVVANVPYVPEREIPELPIEIRGFEPRIALAAGEDGTDLLLPLIADLPRLLARGGHALVEIGTAQRAMIEGAIAAAGLREIRRGLDHAGIERVLVLRRP